jgi:hypothetical protein
MGEIRRASPFLSRRRMKNSLPAFPPPRFLLHILGLVATACQPLPHPFAEDVPPSSLLSPRDSAGIYVAPVAGAPTAAANDLAEAMAAALRDADIPASTRGRNRGSYELHGAASEQPLAGGGVEVSVDWELRAADGRSLGHAPATAAEPSPGWGSSDTVAPEIAAAATPAIRRLVQDDPPVAVAAPDPAVSLRAVAGAPGDGGRSLTRAMDDALRRAHVPIADAVVEGHSLVLAGTVRLSPAEPGKQQVKVSWTLIGADGREIGRIDQENAVPAGSLDGAWGDVAYAVANAAAPGVVALIERAKAVGTGS